MSKTDKIEAEIEEARNNFDWGLVHDKISKNKKKFVDPQALDYIYKVDELIESRKYIQPTSEDDGFGSVKIADKALKYEFAFIRIKYAYESQLATFKSESTEADADADAEDKPSKDKGKDKGKNKDKGKEKEKEKGKGKARVQKVFPASKRIEQLVAEEILCGGSVEAVKGALSGAFFAGDAPVTPRRLRIFTEGLRTLAEYSENAHGDAAGAAGYYSLLFGTLFEHSGACEGAFAASKALCSAFERAVPRYHRVLCAVGDARGALTLLRHCLFPPISTVTSHPFRLKAIRMLIDTDLYHCDAATWVPFAETFPIKDKKDKDKDKDKKGAAQKRTRSRGIEPRAPMEEAAMLLVLLEKETMGVGLTSYDDMYFVLGAFGQSLALATEVERDVTLHSYDAELWKKLAYALVAAGKPENALCICDKCLFAAPNDLDVLYLAASVALDSLEDPAKAMDYAHRAMSVITSIDPSLKKFAENKNTNENTNESDNSSASSDSDDPSESEEPKEAKASTSGIPLRLRLSKFLVVLGISAGKLAQTAKLSSERLAHQKRALGALHRAVACDPRDYLACHYLALQYADLHEVDLALHLERRALALNPGHADSWNAAALLFSAKKLNATALTAAAAGLRHCPGNVPLCMTQAALEIAAGNAPKALETCLTATESNCIHQYVRHVEAAVKTQQQQQQQQQKTSSTGSPAESLPIEVCLTLSKAFAALKRWDDARLLLENQLRASVVRGDARATAEVLAAQGAAMLQQRQGTEAEAEAMLMFDKALSIDPGHLDSLISVATIGHSACNEVVEEMHILSALSLYPFSHSAWYAMGSLLQKKGLVAEATDCLVIAARLEDTSPILPFTTLPRKANI